MRSLPSWQRSWFQTPSFWKGRKLSHSPMLLATIGIFFFLLQSLMLWLHFDTSIPEDSSPIPLPRRKANSQGVAISQRFGHSNSIQTNSSQSEITNATSPYAYAFVIGGIDENRIAYRGFLYNTLIAVNQLRKHGSSADIIVFLQLSPASNRQQLPTEDVRWLKAFDNVSIIQIPTPQRESFADLMLDKFRTLQLTQYRRVMYLDSDILPLCNLDYLFHLSDSQELSLPTILRPNFLVASDKEPANGGMFMVNPVFGAWEKLQSILARQKREGKLLPYPHFDSLRGWGHDHRQSKDSWHSIRKNGTVWKFHAAHSDQGLLYYYLKYVVQDTSVFVGNRVEHWTKNLTSVNPEVPELQVTEEGVLIDFAPPPDMTVQLCKAKNRKEWTVGCYPPYRDIAHYSGKRDKPWQRECKQWYFQKTKYSSLKERFHFWFTELRKVNEKLGMGLDFVNWNKKYLEGLKESPLGYMPMPFDNSKRIMDDATISQ